MKPESRRLIQTGLVWLCRLVAGTTFIISGWSKSIDPWGFTIKIGEYLNVWGLSVPHEAIVAAAVSLACVEFCTGVMLCVGSLKRTSAIIAATMMAVMLPLTVYIAVANPVADCGCFGDLWYISNGATLAKNIVLTAAIVYLLFNNSKVSGLYATPVQWLTIIAALAFPLFLSMEGYHIQPLVDFRPYKIGTPVFVGEKGAASEDGYVYERAGEQRVFTLDELPDSTWTFVSALEPSEDVEFDGPFEVRNSDGDDVSDEFTEGRQMFVIVPEPTMHYLIYGHYVNRLARWAERSEIGFAAVLGGTQSQMERWADWTRPPFDIYTADATALKQMVRGREAIIYVEDGDIVWKRTLSSMPKNLPEEDADAAVRLAAPDDGHLHTVAGLIFLAWMIVVYLLSLSPRLIKLFTRIIALIQH
ncbi:MAG: DoxX family protein [Muribaculaceae bacterium]|nr:DoxX family protein [Muribaculaceae bacterium]